MAELALSNIVDVSVAQAPTGIGPFNVNNLLLLTDETPDPVPGVGYAVYLTPEDVAADFGSGSVTAKMANAIFAQSPNILAGGGYLVIAQFLPAEKLIDGIQRIQPLISFCGVIKSNAYSVDGTELSDAANYVQTQDMILFVQSDDSDFVQPDGQFDLIRQAANYKTRCLLYMNDDYEAATLMAAAYAGRALSTNFAGSNTTQNMQLKTLTTIVADGNMTQTIYEAAQSAGADVYASFAGVAKVGTSGANRFFDQVHNQTWFTTSLKTEIFNALATVDNKVPQTEQGMSTLKGAAQGVCEQAKTNLYCAPGSWSGGTFGNQQDFLRNITDIGYYIYSSPIAKQSQSDRALRKAPLMQIALKEAGGINSSSVLVNINA